MVTIQESKKMRVQRNSSRLAKVMFGVGLFTVCASAAWADETRLGFIVASGANSPAITVPGVNTPTSVICSAVVAGDSGIGQATLLRLNPVATLEWVGFDIADNMGSTAKITAGQSVTAGTHIIFCDFAGEVDLEIENGYQIFIHNGNGNSAAVYVHFVY
jgi:hypothetical protein